MSLCLPSHRRALLLQYLLLLLLHHLPHLLHVPQSTRKLSILFLVFFLRFSSVDCDLLHLLLLILLAPLLPYLLLHSVLNILNFQFFRRLVSHRAPGGLISLGHHHLLLFLHLQLRLPPFLVFLLTHVLLCFVIYRCSMSGIVVRAINQFLRQTGADGFFLLIISFPLLPSFERRHNSIHSSVPLSRSLFQEARKVVEKGQEAESSHSIPVLKRKRCVELDPCAPP